MHRFVQYGLHVYDGKAPGSRLVLRSPGGAPVCTIFDYGSHSTTEVLRTVRRQDDPRWGSLFRLSDTLNLMCDEGLAYHDPAVVKVRQDHDALTQELCPSA